MYGFYRCAQIIGALGMLTQALQSMPIGRLDGGRATTSVFGRKAATFLSASLVLYQVSLPYMPFFSVDDLCVCVFNVVTCLSILSLLPSNHQVVSGIILGNSLQLFWGTVVIIFQNAQEMYARDEITPVDANRRNLLLLIWIIVAATLLPGVPWIVLGAFDDVRSVSSGSFLHTHCSCPLDKVLLTLASSTSYIFLTAPGILKERPRDGVSGVICVSVCAPNG